MKLKKTNSAPIIRSVIPQTILALTNHQVTNAMESIGIIAPNQACLVLAKIYFSKSSANTDPIKNNTICIINPTLIRIQQRISYHKEANICAINVIFYGLFSNNQY